MKKEEKKESKAMQRSPDAGARWALASSSLSLKPETGRIIR